jgi:anti-sigma B factor antagonist
LKVDRPASRPDARLLEFLPAMRMQIIKISLSIPPTVDNPKRGRRAARVTKRSEPRIPNVRILEGDAEKHGASGQHTVANRASADYHRLHAPLFPRHRGYAPMSPVMTTPEFKYLRLSLVDDVVLVEILSKDVQGPDRAQEFSAELAAVVCQDSVQPLLVDLCRTCYLSSMGYSALFKMVKEAKTRQRPIKFCCIDPDVRVGADAVGLYKVVDLYDSREAALAAFAKG